MGGEDIIQCQTCGSCSANDRDETCDINHEHDEAEVPGFMPNGERLGQSVVGTELEEGQLIYESENTGDVIGDSSSLHERIDRVEKSSNDILDYAAPQAEVGSFNDAEVEGGQIILDMSTAENACIKNVDYTGTVEENHMETVTEFKEKCVYVLSENENGCVAENETSNSYPDIGGVSASSAKGKRATFDEQQSSVHVKYHGLSRQGKKKLEELLRQWSEWTAQNCSVSQDKNQGSESGEEIYFPALDIGMGKTSMVICMYSYFPTRSLQLPSWTRSFPMMARWVGRVRLNARFFEVDALRESLNNIRVEEEPSSLNGTFGTDYGYLGQNRPSCDRDWWRKG